MSRIQARTNALTRREFAALGGSALLAACTKDFGLLVAAAPLPPGAPGLLASVVASGVPSVVLDTAKPLPNFTQEGNQTFGASPSVLTLQDQSGGDLITLFAADPGAAAGTELDIVASFQVQTTTLANIDTGVRFAINDGVAFAAIAECIVKGGIKGIGLAASNQFTEESNYPFFVPADWSAGPTTLRLRRTAADDAELIEVNGVAPNPRALLNAGQLAPRTRNGATVEFGCSSAEAQATLDVIQFRSERPATAVPGMLTPTHMRIRDTDSTDRLRFRADFTLGGSSNGINPGSEPVEITLSTPAGGAFYTQALNGFTVMGRAPRRRWSLTDAEKARTGIERLDIDEDPGNSGALFLRDFRTDLGSQDFSTVNFEVLIGDDLLTGTAQLVERQVGSGKWRLIREA